MSMPHTNYVPIINTRQNDPIVVQPQVIQQDSKPSFWDIVQQGLGYGIAGRIAGAGYSAGQEQQPAIQQPAIQQPAIPVPPNPPQSKFSLIKPGGLPDRVYTSSRKVFRTGDGGDAYAQVVDRIARETALPRAPLTRGDAHDQVVARIARATALPPPPIQALPPAPPLNRNIQPLQQGPRYRPRDILGLENFPYAGAQVVAREAAVNNIPPAPPLDRNIQPLQQGPRNRPRDILGIENFPYAVNNIPPAPPLDRNIPRLQQGPRFQPLVDPPAAVLPRPIVPLIPPPPAARVVVERKRVVRAPRPEVKQDAAVELTDLRRRVVEAPRPIVQPLVEPPAAVLPRPIVPLIPPPPPPPAVPVVVEQKHVVQAPRVLPPPAVKPAVELQPMPRRNARRNVGKDAVEYNPRYGGRNPRKQR
jgi:hypothetical protein